MTSQTSYDDSVVTSLGHKVDFSSPACGHVDCNFTATRMINDTPTVICESCFQLTLKEDQAARLSLSPYDENLECIMCSTHDEVRFHPDLKMGICDVCRAQNDKNEEMAECNRLPPENIVADLISPLVYMGCKDSAYNLEGLQANGITRILICCERLPAYHPSMASLTYHRIPLADSLAQNLMKYIPTAMAFISQAVLAGEGVLVHCNAGVSRSGAIITEWLRRSLPELNKSVSLSVAYGKTRRVKLFPNSNFLQQLEAAADKDENEEFNCK